MEKTFLLHLSAHWGDLIEEIKTSVIYTLKSLNRGGTEEQGIGNLLEFLLVDSDYSSAFNICCTSKMLI